MSEPRWVKTAERMPPNDWMGRVITESGDERELVYSGNLWWLPDRSMYVYFSPELWLEKP